MKISSYFKKHIFVIILYILLYAIMTGLNVALTILLADSVEYITLGEYESAVKYFSIGILCLLIRIILNLFHSLMYNKYSALIVRDMSLDCVKQAFKLNSATYTDHKTGEFTQRIVGDPNRIIGSLDTLIQYVSVIISAIVVTTYVFFLNWVIALVIVGVIIIAVIVDIIRVKLRNKNQNKSLKLNDQVYSIVNEVVKSERDIKTSGLENKLEITTKEKYDRYIEQNIKTTKINTTLNMLRVFITNIGIYGTLLLGIFLMEKGLVTISIFMVIYSYNGTLRSFPAYLSSLLNVFSDIKIHTRRIKQLFDEEEYVTEKFGNVKLENVKGEIKFDNVGFKYKVYDYKRDEKTDKLEKTLKSENEVLKDLSFEIEPNTTVAFVGRSGSGKSTILSLMAKMLETDSGQVLIDGVDIKDLDKETLRKSISLVNQFPYIFDMSIKENLLLAKEDASDEEIENAINDSYLDEFVKTLPEGLDTVVGESGIKLSGGQRQRLAIARALLRKSSIIIFDESTSSLDNFAQEHIKKCIDGLKGKSTIVIVAHRLSTIKNVDKIYFLEEGKISDTGTFDELYKTNKEFKDMFTLENLQESLQSEILEN